MIKYIVQFTSSIVLCFFCKLIFGTPIIYVNQVAMDTKSAKIAIVSADIPLKSNTKFTLINVASGMVAFTGKLGNVMKIEEWLPGKLLYQADFSSYLQQGKYVIELVMEGKKCTSEPFVIKENALAKMTIPSILHYFQHQRANSPEEIEADKQIILFGSDKTVDLQGGWCDASGDISKYFSHLAYANFMSPQQIPLVTWSKENAVEAAPRLLTKLGIKDSL